MAVRRRPQPAPPPPPVAVPSIVIPDREEVEEAIHAELAGMADELEALEAERNRLYDRRRELYVRGRSMVPPISGAAMARSARVSDAALVLSARRLTKAS